MTGSCHEQCRPRFRGKFAGQKLHYDDVHPRPEVTSLPTPQALALTPLRRSQSALFSRRPLPPSCRRPRSRRQSRRLRIRLRRCGRVSGGWVGQRRTEGGCVWGGRLEGGQKRSHVSRKWSLRFGGARASCWCSGWAEVARRRRITAATITAMSIAGTPIVTNAGCGRNVRCQMCT